MGTDNPLSNVEIEFKEIDSRNGWAQFYLEIRADSSRNDFTTLAAVKNKNKSLNRYRDVSPYDHSRIVLSKGRCDYINANLMEVEAAQRKYILTQGPLQRTTGHFWLMVWEQKSKAIIMLNRIIEKHQEKCYQYWPIGRVNGGEDVLTLTDVGLEVEFVSEKEYSYYTTRVLRLKDIESGEKREILHFHYTTWPDFGVPQSPTAFLRFLCAVRRSGALSPDVGPPVVHCSAGIGRTGTFCLVDTSLVLMKKNGNNSVNVRDLLMEMRKSRMGLIQTHDQLRFSYLAIIEGINRIDWDSSVDNEVIEYDDYKEKEDLERDSERISSSESEDEPPPLPPPRVASLGANNLNNVSCPPDRPLPSVPLKNDPNSVDGLRERKWAEANKKTAETVAEMKRKQEEYEKWRRVKRKRVASGSSGEDGMKVKKKSH